MIPDMESNVKEDTPADSSASPAEESRSAPTARLLRILEVTLGLVFCAVVMMNFASAASRYMFKKAIVGADEVQVYAMVWVIFVGAAVVAWRRAHLRMDVLVQRMRGRAARCRDALESLLALVVCGTMSWVSFRYVMQIHDMGQHSDGADIPMWIPHTAALVGFSATALISACALYGLLRRPSAVDHTIPGLST